MKFQTRDIEIIKTIYELQGVLAKRHLRTLFWPEKSLRAMEQRLTKLYRTGYLTWPDKDQYKIYPIPEPICLLAWRGALVIAGLFGLEIPSPKSENENQLRLLQKNLRTSGINWVREPRWSLLRHDLAVIDFNLAIKAETRLIPKYMLENWRAETEFRSDPDIVVFETRDRNGKIRQVKKRVLPDAYFEIVDQDRRDKGESHRARFLLELDMSTHDNFSFGREKIAPGVAYIKSDEYKKRFGNKSGRWLMVTNGGPTRLKNMISQVQENAGQNSDIFFFTYLQSIKEGNPLTSPIWRQVDKNEPKPIFIS